MGILLNRLWMRYLLAALLISVVTGVHARYASHDDADPMRDQAQRYAHLQYFGFYASAMAHWNFTEELAPFTNLTWIHVGVAGDPAGGIAEMLVRLRQARDAGVQAVLSIEPFLFTDARGYPRGDQAIQEFLVELRAQLEAEALLDTVAMIYPKDEPFREFVSARDPSYYDQYVSGDVYRDIHRDLVTVNEQIRLVFPETPIGVILSGYELFHKFFSIPENYDWVGFDCYDNLFRACDDKSYVQMYQRLLNYMQPQQRLVAVPETWALNEHQSTTDWPETLAQRLLQHYEIALSEPRFVAFIPFIWSFDADADTPGLGLNRFSELYDRSGSLSGSEFLELVQDIGFQIKHGQPLYPDLAYSETEPHRHRPTQLVKGGVLDVSPDGVVSAWAVDQALPHKSLRMRLVVRDREGDVIYKSRTERAFIADAELSAKAFADQALVGLHGWRHTLPQRLIEAHGAGGFSLEWWVMADGIEQEVMLRQVVEVGGSFRPRLPRLTSVVQDRSPQEDTGTAEAARVRLKPVTPGSGATARGTLALAN